MSSPSFASNEKLKIHDILKKLRNGNPEAYAAYVDEMTQEQARHLMTLMTAPTDKILRAQGVAAAFDSHIRILKAAM